MALLGTHIPNAYMNPPTYMTADPMHPAKQKCVSLPTSGVGKGISSGNFLQFYLDCYIGSPGNPHSECLYGSTNLHDSVPYAPGQAEVCILTNFRCEEGDLFQKLSLILFWLPYWHPWARIPNAYPDPQAYVTSNPTQYAPGQAEVCILTDFMVCEKGSLPATFFNFI